MLRAFGEPPNGSSLGNPMLAGSAKGQRKFKARKWLTPDLYLKFA
jgi:hypothetical protein